MPASQIPIADGLFTWPSAEPRLIGARCGACDQVTFPRCASCPRCGGPDVADVLLARRGTLWTFTTQEFTPKAPYIGPDASYAVGYVELPGECMVESRLVVPDGDAHALAIGDEMELVVVPLTSDAGSEIVAPAFRPVA